MHDCQHVLVPIYHVREKQWFSFQLAEKEMDSSFWGKDIETFSVNTYACIHTYVFRILISELIRDPSPLRVIQETEESILIVQRLGKQPS